jgi:hypothetical protein
MSPVTVVALSEVPCSKSSTRLAPERSTPTATTTQISPVSQTPSMSRLSQSASSRGRVRSSASCSRLFSTHILDAALLLTAWSVARATPRTGRPWATAATTWSNIPSGLDAAS